MKREFAQGSLDRPISDKDHLVGRPDAPIILLQYGDFECPFCGSAYPMIKRLQESLDDDMCFVYRHFPVSTKHKHARKAAEAAEAAGAQNAFWQMHDILYEHQDALSDNDLVKYASGIVKDIARFKEELFSSKYGPAVQEDFMSGVKSGVNGTPTFFINGQRYNGPNNYSDLYSALIKKLGREGR